jgi:MFS family permease
LGFGLVGLDHWISGFSGLATGMMSLVAIRAIMGVMEGSFCPTSLAATNEASWPSRRGFNLGIQQCTFALFGLGFGPIVATQLMSVVPSWRWVFFVAAIPGFILAGLMFKVIREPVAHARQASGAPAHAWATIFRSRNIVVSMGALLCAMTCVFVLSAMVPNYLIDYLKLTPGQMGFVTSAIGFGGFFGQFGLPGVSDFLGRKPVAVCGFLLAALMLWVFAGIGAAPTTLFAAFFVGVPASRAPDRAHGIVAGGEKIEIVRIFGDVPRQVGLRRGQGAIEAGDGFPLPVQPSGFNLVDEHVAAPSVLNGGPGVPDAVFGSLDQVEDADAMAPRNLCNKLLHNCFIGPRRTPSCISDFAARSLSCRERPA